MYQVVEMKGDLEPWWFLEGWQEDIISTKEFENFYDALKYYKKLWFAMEETLPSYISRSSVMTAFGIKRISTGVRSVMNTCRSINQLLFWMIGRKFLRKNTVRDMKSEMTFQIMPTVKLNVK